MMGSRPVLFAPFVLLYIITVRCTVANIIETNSGSIEGKQILTTLGKSVTVYSGIPYAEPPTGSLRFKPPAPKEPWTEVLKATEVPLPCIQQIDESYKNINDKVRKMATEPTSEDCLKLNIWVKDPAPVNAPVLVYIHGGGFVFGKAIGSETDGANLAAEEDIIVVTISYRLNVFGFLGLGHADAPGNVGLMDQNLGLSWVKNNIEKFGGNSESITLMGLSAGSISVAYHLLSAKSEGLFHRAILVSGAPVSQIYNELKDITSKAQKLALATGCSSDDASVVLECLQKVPPELLLEKDFSIHAHSGDYFYPTTDGTFLKEHWSVSLASRRFSGVPILIGTTSEEGGIFALIRNMDLFTGEEGSLNPEEFGKAISNLLIGTESVFSEVAQTFYKNWSNPEDPLMLRDQVLKAYADYMFVCPTNGFSDRFVQAGNKVFRYVYDQKISAFTQKAWLGPSHATDQPIFFGIVLGREGFSEEEEQFSREMMKRIAAFSRTGDPNILNAVSWPPYTLSRRQYMKLSFQSTVGNNFRVQECAFWQKLMPAIKLYTSCQ